MSPIRAADPSAFAAWVLLLVFSAISITPFTPFWVVQVRTAVYYGVGVAALAAAAFWLLALWFGARRVWAWRRARHR